MHRQTSKRIGRVLHVTEAPLGGVVSYIDEILRRQVANDETFIDFMTPEINVQAIDCAGNKRLNVITFDVSRKSWVSLLRAVRVVVAYARKHRPDIIHAHSSFAGIIVRLAKPMLPRKTKVVYCPHSWSFSRESGAASTWVLARVEQALAVFADAIICISRYERDEGLAAGIPASKLHVIENGVTVRGDIAKGARDASDARKLIAFVGRFDRQKGFDVYLEVMRRLGDEARGIVVGGAIVDSPVEYQIPDNVEVLGWQPRQRVLDIYRQADLLLVPSRWEGFGLVAVEAMQARTAVFASRVGGLQDIVVNGETGFQFDLHDIDALVATIRETSFETLADYGRKGHDRCCRFYTAERMNDQIWQLYGELLEAS